MKALVKTEVGKGMDGLGIMDIPKPVPKKNELLIKIMATGICGTDLHIMEDGYPHSSTAASRSIHWMLRRFGRQTIGVPPGRSGPCSTQI